MAGILSRNAHNCYAINSDIDNLIYLICRVGQNHEMTRLQTSVRFGAVSLMALAVACSAHPAAPTSPASAAATSTNAEEGVTLKASAPVPQSPINDVRIAEGPPTLTASAAAGSYASVALQYRFQVLDDAGVVVQDSGFVASPSFTVTAALDFEKRQTWRARAEYQGAVGPWSATASFITPAGAYLRGNEIRDPLTNGTTVGRAFGATFIPGRVFVSIRARATRQERPADGEPQREVHRPLQSQPAYRPSGIGRRACRQRHQPRHDHPQRLGVGERPACLFRRTLNHDRTTGRPAGHVARRRRVASSTMIMRSSRETPLERRVRRRMSAMALRTRRSSALTSLRSMTSPI